MLCFSVKPKGRLLKHLVGSFCMDEQSVPIHTDTAYMDEQSLWGSSCSQHMLALQKL